MLFYKEGDFRSRPKCIVISLRLELLRKGLHVGFINLSEMTENGSFTTDSWDQQT